MSIIINNPSSVNAIADGAITTAKLADGAVTTAKLSTSLANINYFKNPAFSVVQGSASGTITASTNVPTASLGYPGEAEWCIASATSSSTYNFNAQTLTITPSSTNLVYIIQRIEAVDASRLAGKTITLSVEIGCVTGGVNVGVQILQPSTSADTHGTITSPTQTLLYDSPSSSTFISTSRRVNFSTTLPSSSNLGLEVRFIFTPNMTGTSFTFARPKLEEGSTATAFTCEDIAIELAKCQRYFFSLPATPQGFPCPNTGGYAATYNYPFKQTMFRVPAVVPTYTGTSNITSLGTPVVTVNGFSTQIVGTTASNVIWTISANCSAHIP